MISYTLLDCPVNVSNQAISNQNILCNSLSEDDLIKYII